MSTVSRLSRGTIMRLVVLLAVALASIAATPTTASAAQVRQTTAAGSECTNLLVKSGSSKAKLSALGSVYVDITADGQQATVVGIRSQVQNLSCTTDNGVATSRLSVRYRVYVDTVNLANCSLGVPSGVSCSVEGKTAILTQSRNCYNVSICRRDTAAEWNLDPSRAAGAIVRVRYKVFYSGQQSGKEAVPTSGTAGTPTRTWYPWT